MGSECVSEGTTLASLPLAVGHYRTGNASDDLRRCRDYGDSSGCVGGVGAGEGPCKPGLEARDDVIAFVVTCATPCNPGHSLDLKLSHFKQGPYCLLCTIRDDTHYYSLDESACLICGGNDLNPLWVGLGVLVALPGLVTLGWCCRKWVPRRLQPLFRSAWGIYDSLSIRGKVKQALSFCVSSPSRTRGTHQPED